MSGGQEQTTTVQQSVPQNKLQKQQLKLGKAQLAAIEQQTEFQAKIFDDFFADSNKKYYSSYGKFDFEGSIMDSYIRAWSDDSRNFWHYVVISENKTNMLTDDTSNVLISLIESTKIGSEF